MNENLTLVDCPAVIPGCADCMAEHQADMIDGVHECGITCEITGGKKQQDEGDHQLYHQPIHCLGCGTVVDDRRGTRHLTSVACPSGCCTEIHCTACGLNQGGWGPIDCPTCGYWANDDLPRSRKRKTCRPRNQRWR